MNFGNKDGYGDLIEALLHLMDGGNPSWVAKRYRFSESYLKRVLQGGGRQGIREEAQTIYRAYRREQLTGNV